MTSKLNKFLRNIVSITTILLALILINPGQVTAATMTYSLYSSYSGDYLLDELPLGDNGWPVSAARAPLSVELSPAAANGTTNATYTTSSDCVFFSDSKGGGWFGQSHTSGINSINIVTIAAVDDSTYKGTRNCVATVTLSSTDPAYDGLTKSLTFTITDDETAPAPAPAPTTTTTTTTQAVTEKPATPTTALLNGEGNAFEPTPEGETTSYVEDAPIVIGGTTVPNGVVKLYIFSEPQEAEVTADSEGNWTYTITSLNAGDHRVEVEVTDPATGETSERAEVLAFSVVKAEQVIETAVPDTATAEAEASNSNVPTMIGVLLFLAIAGASAWWFFRIKKKKQNLHSASSSNSEAIKLKDTKTEQDEPPANDNSDTAKDKDNDNDNDTEDSKEK